MDYSDLFASIPDGAHVVFDWDNTLKLYDGRAISCRFDIADLSAMRRRGCVLYVMSAIAPRRAAFETLLYEVETLGLTWLFMDDDPAAAAANVEVDRRYCRKGRIVSCGYDKAEVFMEISGHKMPTTTTPTYFFDDEPINIYNFRHLVPNSHCHLVI